MSPPFIFRIDEIREKPTAAANYDSYGNWIPSIDSEGNERIPNAGATGVWWYCDGQRIQPGTPPQPSTYYKTFSVFYSNGCGFWVLKGDAINPPAAEAWRSLWFDHDDQDYSSYLTNAGNEKTLRCQRFDQKWPNMLLPSTNQVQPVATAPNYGGMKGDLAIFLALMAFSMDRRHVREYLPMMFINGAWAVHSLPHGRVNQRGVVVYVYSCPGSTATELSNYEDGVYGKYYH